MGESIFSRDGWTNKVFSPNHISIGKTINRLIRQNLYIRVILHIQIYVVCVEKELWIEQQVQGHRRCYSGSGEVKMIKDTVFT